MEQKTVTYLTSPGEVNAKEIKQSLIERFVVRIYFG